MKNKRRLRTIKNKLLSFASSKKSIIIALITILLTIIIFPIILHVWIATSLSDKKYKSVDDIPHKRTAIVFGAGLYDNEPGDVLKDRVYSAVELYEAGKVDKIIMSGDNRTTDYDEPSAMMNLAKERGIPEDVLQPDYAGRRTYDTCARAKSVFDLDEAILVTQDFHMDRALYTCNELGIESIGFIADKSKYKGLTIYTIRDYVALVKAVWDIHIDEPDNVVPGDVIEF